MRKTKSGKSISIEALLADHTPPVRLLVERLRAIIHETIPGARESAHAVWHSISYHHPRSGYFCGIFPHKDRVDLAFEFGVLLLDPQGLLDGSGKQVRYLHLYDDKDIPGDALKALLQAAINLPEGRDAKLALVRSAARPIQPKNS